MIWHRRAKCAPLVAEPTDNRKPRSLVFNPRLFMIPGGTRGDERRLRERLARAEREGLITIEENWPPGDPALVDGPRPTASGRSVDDTSVGRGAGEH